MIIIWVLRTPRGEAEVKILPAVPPGIGNQSQEPETTTPEAATSEVSV